MLEFLFIQGIGAMGFITLALSYFKKEKRQILFIQILAYFFFSIHYFLLNGITGALCNLIGLFALIAIYLLDKYNVKNKNKNIVSIAFILILLIANIIRFQNAFSIFPLIASIIVIISFIKDDEDMIRAIGVISAVCWLIYAIVYKSYISIIFETLTLMNVCVAFIKNHKNQ